MPKTPKDSIYSDEKQSIFLRDETLASSYLAEKAYDLDRSSPLGALKNMLREYYSPNTLLDNKIATAVVLRIEPNYPTYIEAARQTSDQIPTEMVRIRVLSDPRNFWIPEPKTGDDPVISLHPIVRNNTSEFSGLKAGDIVEVEFFNNKSQFSNFIDVGQVKNIVSRTEVPTVVQPLAPPQIELPPVLPAPKVIPKIEKKPTPNKPMKTSSKGIEFLAGVEGFVPHPYQDSSGIWTVGVGSVIDRKYGTVANRRRKRYEKYVIQNLGNARLGKQLANDDKKALAYYRKTKKPLITRAQADEIKRIDLKQFEKIVNNKFPNTPLKQNQFDALVSFAYNSGSIWNRLANPIKKDPSNKESVRKAFTDPRNTTSRNPRTGKRIKLRGLAKRRAKEARLFNEGEYRNIKVRYSFGGKNYFGDKIV
jgi:GH24 family phage-related lysozyme (muramidase)